MMGRSIKCQAWALLSSGAVEGQQHPQKLGLDGAKVILNECSEQTLFIRCSSEDLKNERE